MAILATVVGNGRMRAYPGIERPGIVARVGVFAKAGAKVEGRRMNGGRSKGDG
jgi:hypothetical protein